MKVIFLKDVPRVGRKYDIKDVSDGYALNMLIPKGLVQVATPEAIRKIETAKSLDLANRQIQNDLLLKNLEKIRSVVVNLKEKANEKGHLFAGVTKETLAIEIKKTSHMEINPEFIVLPKPIKETGSHKVLVQIGDKKAEFAVIVEAF